MWAISALSAQGLEVRGQGPGFVKPHSQCPKPHSLLDFALGWRRPQESWGEHMTNTARLFHSIYTHGLVRVAVAIPLVRVADPVFNMERTIDLGRRASAAHAAIVLFPELGISAYSNEDLFHQ